MVKSEEEIKNIPHKDILAAREKYAKALKEQGIPGVLNPYDFMAGFHYGARWKPKE